MEHFAGIDVSLKDSSARLRGAQSIRTTENLVVPAIPKIIPHVGYRITKISEIFGE